MSEPGEPPSHWPALLDVTSVTRETGFSKTKIYRMMAEQPPQFPRACKAGGSTVWHAAEVWQWIANRPRVSVRTQRPAAPTPPQTPHQPARQRGSVQVG